MTDAEIEAVAQGLFARTLPKARWTHGAHFATALWLLRQPGPAPAEEVMPPAIRAYNEAIGGVNSDTQGYHATITLGSLRMARRVLESYPADTGLGIVLAGLLVSPLGRPDWVERHWSRERLFGTAARRGWVEPDLEPLPQIVVG